MRQAPEMSIAKREAQLAAHAANLSRTIELTCSVCGAMFVTTGDRMRAPDNLQLAHARCNIAKGNRAGHPPPVRFSAEVSQLRANGSQNLASFSVELSSATC